MDCRGNPADPQRPGAGSQTPPPACWGISGLSSDLRVLEQAWHEGHARARLAIKTFVHRIARHIAGHAAALQRLDGIIFTGGIGENSVLIRRLVSERLSVFGLAMDAARNQQPNPAGERLISRRRQPGALRGYSYQ